MEDGGWKSIADEAAPAPAAAAATAAAPEEVDGIATAAPAAAADDDDERSGGSGVPGVDDVGVLMTPFDMFVSASVAVVAADADAGVAACR